MSTHDVEAEGERFLVNQKHSYPSASILVLQVDIPNIQKQRKHLAKLVLDMDSARTR